MPSMKINDLPGKILSKIFENLNLSDRKCVRATCKHWYQICNYISITQKEKFVFTNECTKNFINIVDTLSNSSNKFLNIEFFKVERTDNISYLLRSCVSEIRSLCFKKCTIRETEIENLVASLINLESLSIVNCICDFSPRLFDKLVVENICREQTITFEFVTDSWLTDCIFHKIRIIFPNLKNITLGCRVLCSSKDSYHLVMNSGHRMCYSLCRLSLPTIANYFKSSADKFEELNLSYMKTETSFMNDLASVPNLKLKKFCLTKYNESETASFHSFFGSQSNLEYIDLSKSPYFTVDFLPHLLNYCKELRTLKMVFPQKSSQCQRILKILATSHLYSFEMVRLNTDQNTFCNKVNEPVEPRIDLSSVECENNKLNYLAGFYNSLSESDIFWILRTFRKLLYFGYKLAYVKLTNAILQTLFQYQTSLQTLEIHGTYITDYGFTGVLIDDSISNWIQRENEFVIHPVHTKISTCPSTRQILEFRRNVMSPKNEVCFCEPGHDSNLRSFEDFDKRFQLLQDFNDSQLKTILKEKVKIDEKDPPIILQPAFESFSIQQLKYLKQCELVNCQNITDISFKEFIFYDLRYLSIKNCDKITDIGFQYIYESNPRLEYLFLENVGSISFPSLLFVLNKLRRLHTLSIINCLSLPEDIHSAILKCVKPYLRIFEYGYESILDRKCDASYSTPETVTVNLNLIRYMFNIFTNQWDSEKQEKIYTKTLVV